MKYIKPKKLKVLVAMFFGTGIWGIISGMFLITPTVFFIVVFGVINLCLGGFCGYRLLTQVKPESNKRNK
ncbi:hypothetical protein [Candidatus Nitrosotenuis cloacae]|jgi:hypothetical protein|uniref:hypothetical protein n=1 Tax=Candidatus Nitrosotenuis cloacae TaxID=1603555 RepID=UPI0022830D83|nr:hypothetical protein [Candidatus Nitrosotenuis cloacae]